MKGEIVHVYFDSKNRDNDDEGCEKNSDRKSITGELPSVVVDHDSDERENKAETPLQSVSAVEMQAIPTTASLVEEVEESVSESEPESETENNFVRRSTRDPSLSMLERADVKKLVSLMHALLYLMNFFPYIIRRDAINSSLKIATIGRKD